MNLIQEKTGFRKLSLGPLKIGLTQDADARVVKDRRQSQGLEMVQLCSLLCLCQRTIAKLGFGP